MVRRGTRKEETYLVSLLSLPAVGSGRWSELFFLSAVAVATILSEYINSQRIEVKWPNDVLINGKKIAGILLEVLNFGAKAPAVVMGIELTFKPKEFEYPVTCIQDYKNEITSSDEVLTSLQILLCIGFVFGKMMVLI